MATWTKPWPLVAHGRERELPFAKKRKRFTFGKEKAKEAFAKKKEKGSLHRENVWKRAPFFFFFVDFSFGS